MCYSMLESLKFLLRCVCFPILEFPPHVLSWCHNKKGGEITPTEDKDSSKIRGRYIQHF